MENVQEYKHQRPKLGYKILGQLSPWEKSTWAIVALGQKSTWAIVALGQKILGQLSPWTIVPRAKICLDNGA